MNNRVDGQGAEAYDQTHKATPMMQLSTFPCSGTKPARPPRLATRPRKGVQMLQKKPARFKVGIVTVQEGRTPKLGKSFWELRYVDPGSGREVRRRLSGRSRDEVRGVAENLTSEAYQGRGYLAGRPKAPMLEDGIVQTIKLSVARPGTKAGNLRRAKPFLVFMAANYPSAKTWGDIRAGMIEHYVRDLEAQKLARDTVRLRLAPVRAAWRRMRKDYPDLVNPTSPIMLAKQARREIECLRPGEVATLLDWVREYVPDLWPMACLQALAGLRMLEAAALRAQDVDLAAETLTVGDTGWHIPKTEYSFRTIPVCGEVREALKLAMTGQKVRPTTGELFTNRVGRRYDRQTLSQFWSRTIRRAAAGVGCPRLAQVPARKLRAAFVTMASKAGASDRILKSYIGHSPKDPMGGHYRKIEPDELRAVSGLMDGWREFEKPVAPGNIPAKFASANCR